MSRWPRIALFAVPLLTSDAPIRRIRYFIFLKDVAKLSVTAFGGPQVHLVLFLQLFVKQRRYLSEAELLEIHALCQILPGPTSTQTITALGFRMGGPTLAYMTLFIWAMPSVCMMSLLGLGLHFLQQKQFSLDFLKFIGPIAVALLAHAGWQMGRKVLHTQQDWGLMLGAMLIAVVFKSPYICPLVLLIGGALSALRYKKLERREKQKIKIRWENLWLWAGVLAGSAILGAITHSLPVRLFENFYRNGSMVFGGGHVLAPILYTEFVEFKKYLTADEFLSGLAFSQVMPGPNFSISAFLGVLSMPAGNTFAQLLGGLSAALGVFLPGVFMVFFVYRFWEQLKGYRGVRASLEGINAVSVGLTAAAAIQLFWPLAKSPIGLATFIGTMAILIFTKIQPYFLIIFGLLAGWLFMTF